MNIKTKLLTGTIMAAFLTLVFVPTTFAAKKVVVKKNGAGSKNTVTAVKVNKTKTQQLNLTAVGNVVIGLQNTGLNSAVGNTGDGGTDVNSGDTKSTVTNRTTTGGNEATVNPCGCEVTPCECTMENSVVIAKNGAGSKNEVTVYDVNKTKVEQANATIVVNAVVVAQNTGLNSAVGNTGDGEVSVDSGNAELTATNSTITGGNVYNPGM